MLWHRKVVVRELLAMAIKDFLNEEETIVIDFSFRRRIVTTCIVHDCCEVMVEIIMDLRLESEKTWSVKGK
jgi:hypothetical protein